MALTHQNQALTSHLIKKESQGWVHHWHLNIDLRTLSYLNDHGFQGMVVLPGSAYVSMAAAAAQAIGQKETAFSFTEIKFQNLLILEVDQPTAVSITLSAVGEHYHFCCLSNDGQTVYASLNIETAVPTFNRAPVDIATLQSRLPETQAGTDLYTRLEAAQNEYGRAFRGIQAVWQTESEALVQIKLADGLTAAVQQEPIHPVGLDVCTQSMAAAHDSGGKTFMLTGFDKIQLRTDLSNAAWSHAELVAQTANGIKGNIILLDQAGMIIGQLQGVQYQYLGQADTPQYPLAISATFTSEPVAESLEFWRQTAELPFKVQFAPYNQLFQQLFDPQSLLAQNESGVNVMLVRFEDWMRHSRHLALQVDEANKEIALANHLRHRLPNQLEIAHLNQYETEYVFKEIFVDRCYLKHGITLQDGDTIIDIGANIGLFSLFVQQEVKDTTIFAFDPSPPIFEILKTNLALYGQNVFPFNLGISDRTKEDTFTFYEKSSVFSSFNADTEEDETAVREVVINMLTDSGISNDDKLTQYVDELMADRMHSTSYTCQLKSLSDIIEAHQIENIDLLKVDAEKSEWAILQGIKPEHWPKIKQIVLEVHDKQGDLIRRVQAFLKQQGFDLAIEAETLLKNSGLYNIFGTRPELAGRSGHRPSASAKVEQVVSELETALHNRLSTSATPHFLLICPPSPEIVNNAALHRHYLQLERRLQENLAAFGHLQVINSTAVAAAYSVEKMYDATSDQLGHVPYTPQFFAGLGSLIARQLHAFQRQPYKVIVLDCDNTLWGGIVGEDGVEGIDTTGVWAELQHFMINQMNAGMLLCLNSKNNEDDIMAVFDHHPDMPLKKEHLVGWRINWQPKSQNLKSLAKELNLGLDSIIFLDDNPMEIAEVQANAPQVLAIQLPSEPATIPQFLQHIWAFDSFKQTQEDSQRTKMYQQNAQRMQFQQQTSLADFLAGLELDIKVERPSAAQLARVAQLTQRTNQFNLTTIRRTPVEIEHAMAQGALEVWAITVRDRFGDYGLVGDLFLKSDGQSLIVDTFLLSCRVLGRGVEHHMMAHLGRLAQTRGLQQVQLFFMPTQKNKPALAFLESIGSEFKAVHSDGFIYTFPADVAATTHYSQETDVAVKNVKGKTVDTESAGPVNTAVFAQIAQKFNDPIKIWQQIEARKVQKRAKTVAYIAPANNTEKVIAAVWQQVLGVEKVGVNDNFREVGGTSLNGVQLIAQLKRELGVNLSIVDLFEYPTVRAMTQFIDNAAESENKTAVNGRDRGARRRENRKARRRRSES